MVIQWRLHSDLAERGKRHGFHFNCHTCGSTAVVGGIEDPKQFSRIIRDQIWKGPCHQSNHDYELKQSYHAAELAHSSITPVTTRAQTINTTYTVPTGCVLASSNFTAGKKYLISVTAQVDSASATLPSRIRTVHGSTAFAESEMGVEPDTVGERNIYSFFTVFTQPGTAESISINTAATTSGTANGHDNVTINAIKLSDDLTEDTGSGGDWKFAENATNANLTSATGIDGASITFTPAVANNKWLVMTRSRIDTANAITQTGSKINSSGTITDTDPFVQFEGDGHASEFFVITLARVFQLGASSQTMKEQSYNSNLQGVRTHSGVFALNLSKMRNESDTFNDTVTDTSATNYATTLATINITPDVTGDVWVYGCASYDLQNAGIFYKGRIQVDNVDIYGANTLTTEAYNLQASFDALDELPFNQQSIVSLSNSAHTIDLDGSTEAATAGRGARYKTLFAVTMELPAGGATLTKLSSDDVVSITEEAGRVRAVPKISSDVVGITEEAGRIRALSKVISETLGITEQAVYAKATSIAKSVEETVGILEEASAFLAQPPPPVELTHYTTTPLTTRQTVTGTTTYTDVTDQSIPDTFFEVGQKYLLLANGQWDNSDASDTTKMRMVHGSTEFAGSEHIQETNDTTVKYVYKWFDVWTAQSGEAVKMQIAPHSDSANTCGIDLARVVAIKISSGVAENTDWFFDSETANTSLATSDSSSNNASITFTPATASDDWIVLALSRIDMTGGTADATFMGSRIARSGESTSTDPFHARTTEDPANERAVYFNMRVFTLGAASNTFEEKSFSSPTGAGTRTHSKIFALNLSKLKNYAFSAYDNTGVSVSNTTNYAVNIATTSITPDVQGDVLILSQSTYATDAGTGNVRIRLQVDNSDSPAGQTTKAYVLNDAYGLTADNRLQMPIMTMVEDMTTAAHTIDLDASSTSTGTLRQADRIQLVALTMELLEAGGQNYVKISSDLVSLLEESQRAMALGKSISELVGITEEPNKSIARRPQAPDIVGVGEETVRAMGRARAGDDTVTVGEQALWFRSRYKIVEETVGIAEQIQHVVNKIRKSEDVVGILEESVRARTMARLVDDLISVTEQVVRDKQIVKTVADVVSINEETRRAITLTRISQDDVVGINEETLRLMSLARIVADTVGITEESTRYKFITKIVEDTVAVTEETRKELARSIVKIIDEPVAITEQVGYIRNRIRGVDETISIGEAAVIARAIVKLVDDQVTVNEEIQKSRDLIKVIDEVVTISEELIRDKQIVRVVEDVLNLTEEVNRALAMVRIIDEQVTIDEVVGHILNKTKVVEDVMSINEAVDYVLTPQGNQIIKIIDETISIGEDASRKMDLVRLVEENVQVAEAVVKAAQMVKLVNETVAIEEAAGLARNLVKVIEESVSIEELSTPIRAITKIVEEIVSVSEESVSSIGKIRIVEEALQILESIVEKLAVYVPPPVEPIDTRVGGYLTKRPKRFRTRKGYRIVHLGPRYYLPPPTPRIKAESLRRLEQRKVKQQLLPRYRIFVECRAVYSRAAPAPSVEDIRNKLELNSILERAGRAQRLSSVYDNQYSNDNSYGSNQQLLPELMGAPVQQIQEPSIPIKTVVRVGAISKYDKFEIYNTEIVSRYDKLEIVKQESPQIKYDKFQLVKNEIVSSYVRKKAIPKNWEDQILTLEQLIKIMAMDDIMDRL